ncbi:hypothetical protein AAT19DRAFT_10411 [Rhodotorula toruloides]|uniref:Uncharacterized protein n=1 Tax=Rhodotorula toruloides TaxID=5286 RepID=A0A2T0A0P6_RHOTO|nr:hypothetical protein AAT19DRAFT_10411 [Rhodotorula toruloides]
MGKKGGSTQPDEVYKPSEHGGLKKKCVRFPCRHLRAFADLALLPPFSQRRARQAHELGARLRR